MSQLLAPSFGSGSDGELTISSNTTDSPVDATCTGTSGTTSLSATNASFSAGDRIWIHQSQGTGVGNWEVNTIDSYSAGTITTSNPLANDYVSGAQVLVMKEYSGVTINSTLTAKAWDGSVGGILAYCVSGKLDGSGAIDVSGADGVVNTDTGIDPSGASGGGFLGGDGDQNNQPAQGTQGGGTSGSGSGSTSANGNGGGGGYVDGANNGAGGGGGNGTSGGDGGAAKAIGVDSDTWIGGTGGNTAGSANLSTMVLGGGGGGAVNGSNFCGSGGSGGGILVIFAKKVDISSLTVNANGGNGGDHTGDSAPGGGAGAGGSVLIKSQTATLGSGKITASGGTGGQNSNNSADGGDGGDGRIRVEACSLTGSTTPSASTDEGGHSYCGGTAIIY